jgi:hypothetical protein
MHAYAEWKLALHMCVQVNLHQLHKVLQVPSTVCKSLRLPLLLCLPFLSVMAGWTTALTTQAFCVTAPTQLTKAPTCLTRCAKLQRQSV